MILSVISAIAGLLIATVSLALLWQQKIYIDAHTKQITKIVLPFGITLQTNVPVIAIVFLGFALILVPVMKQPAQTFVALKGHVRADEPLMVYVLAAQQETNGDFLIQVPGHAYYTVMYLHRDGAPAIDSKSVDLVGRHPDPFQLPDLQVPELLAGYAAGLPTAAVHTEAPEVVNQFK